MSGQPIASDRFFLFNTILVLTNLVVQSMGLLIGAASPSLEASTFIGPICAIPGRDPRTRASQFKHKDELERTSGL